MFGESYGGYGAITHALRHSDIWSTAAAWPKTSRLRSPVPRLGSTSLASNSSSGDWRVANTTYTIKIQTLNPLILGFIDLPMTVFLYKFRA